MNIKTTLGVLFLAGTAFAQGTQMPLPAYTSTYSNSGHTRGFYFQAPSNAPFIIAGLRVPDDTGHGTQNVEVIRYSAQPAIYPSTSNGTQLFYSAGQPSANIIPTSILVNPGDWIGILGGCGDSSIMHSSYGAGAYTSDVMGAPVTLYRLLTQTNIAATGGSQPTSGFVSSSSLGRVEVYVTPSSGYAQSNPYGEGCGGVQEYASYYESFATGTFDLGGASGAETVLTHINGGAGFVVVPGASAWFTPTSSALALTANQVSTARPLGFAVNFPGGVSVTDLYISSNGFVWLASSTNSDSSPTAAELVSQGPRIAMYWRDLRPASGGGTGSIHFDVDAANGVAYVTFLGVEQSGNSSALIDMQLAIYSTGNFELRYGQETMSTSGAGPAIVGYSPGNGALEPPPSDLTLLPIITAPDNFVPNLQIASDRPVEGSTMNLNVSEIPPGSVLGAMVLSGTQIFPGVQPVGGLGVCRQLVGLDDVYSFLPTSSTFVQPFPVPASGFTGAQVYVQVITLSPGVNPLGVAVSNGLEWLIEPN